MEFARNAKQVQEEKETHLKGATRSNVILSFSHIQTQNPGYFCMLSLGAEVERLASV